MDWKTLMMVSQNGGDPKMMIALAFQEMATNAQKIGELNISPDLLNSLIAAKPAIHISPSAPAPPKGK